MSSDARPSTALQAAKLAAWVRARDVALTDGPAFAPGPVVHAAEESWLFVDPAEPPFGVGAALAWARRHARSQVHLVTEDETRAAALARRAACFDAGPQVWLAQGAELVPVGEAPPLPVGLSPHPEAELFAPVLRAAGLEVVVEAGVLRGELRGLEVARVAPRESGGAAPRESGGVVRDTPGQGAVPEVVVDVPGIRQDQMTVWELRVGVGSVDQEISALVNESRPASATLDDAVRLVRRHRRPGAPPHPLNQLVPERWLRTVLLHRPDLVGARSLAAIEPVPPRRDLRSRGVAPMLGVGLDGDAVIVVASCGLDLEAIPAAAEARAAYAPGAKLVLAIPAADVHRVTEELASSLREPARIVALPDGWVSLDAVPAGSHHEEELT